MSKSRTRAAKLHSIRVLLGEEAGAQVTHEQYAWHHARKNWAHARYVPKMFDSFTEKYVRQCYIISHLRPGPVQLRWITARNNMLPQFSNLFTILRESYGIDISAADLVDQILPTVPPEIVELWRHDAAILNSHQNT